MSAAAPGRAVPNGWLAPAWAHERVGALMTTRAGGVSAGPWSSMNLGSAVGDDPAAVAANRSRLAEACAARAVFLRQVHGVRVVELGSSSSAGDAVAEADASFTREPGVACVVQVADCLPVLFAAPGGRAVGAAHAGWRGLVGGVLEATADAVAGAASCAPREIDAWLGACIGADAFEVGADVRDAFAAAPGGAVAVAHHFRPRFGAPGKWLADLRGLATGRLRAVGVERIEAVGDCVVADRSRFFSYRRDGVTGRMAAAVWIRPG